VAIANKFFTGFAGYGYLSVIIANVYSTVSNRVRMATTLPPQLNMKNTYSFPATHDAVLRNGKPFFTSPINNSCMSSMKVGIVIPHFGERAVDDVTGLGHYGTAWADVGSEIVVGGGSCCYGYLMGITHDSKINAILAIDFNIKRIEPVIFFTRTYKDRTEEIPALGLLVSGAGCSGAGVRFVDFTKTTPTSTPIVVTDEKIVSYDKWLAGYNPLDVKDIWERLQKVGIKVDKERTLATCTLVERFSNQLL
jgi:hypothetical protein